MSPENPKYVNLRIMLRPFVKALKTQLLYVLYTIYDILYFAMNKYYVLFQTNIYLNHIKLPFYFLSLVMES